MTGTSHALLAWFPVFLGIREAQAQMVGICLKNRVLFLNFFFVKLGSVTSVYMAEFMRICDQVLTKSNTESLLQFLEREKIKLWHRLQQIKRTDKIILHSSYNLGQMK